MFPSSLRDGENYPILQIHDDCLRVHTSYQLLNKTTLHLPFFRKFNKSMQCNYTHNCKEI